MVTDGEMPHGYFFILPQTVTLFVKSRSRIGETAVTCRETVEKAVPFDISRFLRLLRKRFDYDSFGLLDFFIRHPWKMRLPFRL